MQNPLNDPEPDDEIEECDHDEYETDILTGRATCGMCGHHWFLSAAQLWREQQRQEAYDKEQRYWERVDEGRQRAKDGER